MGYCMCSRDLPVLIEAITCVSLMQPLTQALYHFSSGRREKDTGCGQSCGSQNLGACLPSKMQL